MAVPNEIECVDCGGRCYLLSSPPDTGFQAGDVVAYRCSDCLDRWDIELTEEDLRAPAPAAAPTRRRRRLR